MSAVSESLQTALTHHRRGKLEQAERVYQDLLRIDPAQPDALHLLGLIAHQRKDHASAVDLIRKALTVRPQAAIYHANLGAAYRAMGEGETALECFREAVRLDADSAEAQFNLSLTLRGLRRYDEAEPIARRAVELDPRNSLAHHNLGVILAALGQRDEALACFLRAIEIDPTDCNSQLSAGMTLIAAGKPEQAIPYLQRVLTLRPDHADARNWLGRALHESGRLHEAADFFQRAIAEDPHNALTHMYLGNAFISSRQLEEAGRCYRRVVEIDPDSIAGWTNLANVLKTQQKLDEAADAYRNVLRLVGRSAPDTRSVRGTSRRIDPGQPLAELWLATLCPIVFQSVGEIDAYRERLAADLERLAARKIRLDLSHFDARASVPPGHLQYHGRDNRPLLEQFAGVFEHCFPTEPSPPRAGKPKIGVLVTSGHEGVFARFQGAIFERMNRDLFEVTIICSPTGRTALSDEMNCDSIGYLTMPQRFEETVEAIRAARFDLLYFWETGSDVTNYFIPFCRLASVQCAGPGNSDTSGNPAIDYFLSPDLREIDAADRHYTERLVRTKTLDSLQKRMAPPQRPKLREEFGFTPAEHLYVCAQKLRKVHPEFDELLAGILRRDKRGTVVLIQDHSEISAAMIRERFRSTIGDVAGRIHLLPRLDFNDYLSLIRIADVLLDPIHYGGGITLYDSMSLGKPVVTWPSRFVRGRYALGLYRKMGLDTCIASTPGEYVDIAVALGSDPLYRSAVEAELQAASGVLFEDEAIVREHERVFLELIEESRSR